MSSIYSGLATCGRINAIIGMIFVGLMSVIVLCIGVHLILKEPLRTSKTMGKITEITQSSYTVQYSVGNHIYSTSIGGYDSDNYVGKSVNVNYDPNMPQNARVGFSNRSVGTMLIISAIVVCLLVGLNTYFIMKSKTYAAVEGGSDALHDLGNVL